MRVETGVAHSFAAQATAARTGSGTDAFASMLAAGAASTDGASATQGDGQKPDFTSMTRQELFDWMNAQLSAGKMSIEESAPFLAMTVRFSVADGGPVDMATDTTRFDFTEKARQGLAFCRSHLDYEGAARLERALAIMQDA